MSIPIPGKVKFAHSEQGPNRKNNNVKKINRIGFENCSNDSCCLLKIVFYKKIVIGYCKSTMSQNLQTPSNYSLVFSEHKRRSPHWNRSLYRLRSPARALTFLFCKCWVFPTIILVTSHYSSEDTTQVEHCWRVAKARSNCEHPWMRPILKAFGPVVRVQVWLMIILHVKPAY